MAKSGTCELCGLPDDSYTIEDNGNVFKVCKLCHDGFYEKQGIDPSAPPEDPITKLVSELGIEPTHSSKVETLNDAQMRKLLTPSSDERKKLYASLRKAQKGKNSIAADTEELKRELEMTNEEIEAEIKRFENMKRNNSTSVNETETDTAPRSENKRTLEEIEEEERRQAVIENVKSAGASLADVVNSEDVDESTEAAMSKLIGGARVSHVESAPASEPVAVQAQKSEQVENDDTIEGQISFDLPEFDDKKSVKAEKNERTDKSEKAADLDREQKLAAMREKLQRDANPTIDDERIKITSPEVELKKDTRPKTNLDVAVKEHISSVRFIDAFKFVMHPATYSIFAGLVVLAISTAFFITMTWKEAVITFAAGAGAVCIGFLLVWYLKRRFAVDRRTLLLRIRQEQILFNSMTSPCYRELKTKYPIIKALAWLLNKLSVLLPVIVIIGGTVAAVVLVFLQFWWLLAPVLAGAAVAAVLVYYILKFTGEAIYYVLDIERNQQIMQQSLLDMLSDK